MKRRPPQTHGMRPRRKRSGSVLLLVVVVVALLTLAAYNFAKTMTTEYEAASMFASDAQARAAADSGVEFAATLIGHKDTVGAEYLIHNPQFFMGQVVSPSPHPKSNGRFSIIAPVEQNPSGQAIRYGLMDESAKLNVNYLPNMGLSIDDIDTMMVNIPNMTKDIAESLLDWMDTDDDPNPYGAESETYQQMSPPYKAKNGPFESIDELLLVKGITPTLLYGEDQNRNGLLDPNENDGDATPPFDNADGVLDRGFVGYLSVYGRESNRQSNGKLKINVNNGYLTELYDALVEQFDKDTAQFIIAYRIGGPATRLAASQTNPVPTASNMTSLSSTTSVAMVSVKDNEFAINLANYLAAVASGTVGTTTRDGIDLSRGGSQTIESLWVLIGSQASVSINGKSTTLNSPWDNDPGSLSSSLPIMLDKLTTTDDEYLEGRININLARREVLMALTGPPSITMTTAIVDGIIAAQGLDANGQPQLDKILQHKTTAWLFTDGLVDLPGMVTLDPWITAHGDVYQLQAVGFFDGGGPVSRVEATIDGTQRPPRITLLRDMNELGRGFSRSQLLPIQIQR